MNLKIGDKVRMTPQGFRFYSNVDTQFIMHSVGLSMNSKHYTSAVCGLMAVHGVGTVKRFNSEGSPYIVWNYKLDGMKYYYTHYFEVEDVKKLSFLDKLLFKIQGRI